MSVRTLPGTFRTLTTSGVAINLRDVVSWGASTFQSIRSGGSTLIDTLPLTPTQQQKWTLIAVSIQAGVVFQSADSSFGKLGKLVAGLVPSGADTPGNFSGLSAPLLPLPDDSSLIATLWDPAADPMPPVQPLNANPPAQLNVQTQISPPVPRPLVSGDNMGIGLWLLRSIIGGNNSSAGVTGLAVVGAKYTVIYDDGT